MAASLCRGCGVEFAGLRAFDLHLRTVDEDTLASVCLEPSKVGLVVNKRGRWGSGQTVNIGGSKVSSYKVHECEDTGKLFYVNGRGRPPKTIDSERAIPLPKGVTAVPGQYIDADGNVSDSKASAKPKPKAKPKAKPASAKVLTAAQVPPPPPAKVDGMTLAQELAELDLPMPPPSTGDSFDEDEEFAPDWVGEPEPDEYMAQRIDNGELAYPRGERV